MAALVSMTTDQMPMMMNPMSQAASALLLALGGVVLINGVLLVLGVEIPAGPQGAAMIVYGILMIITGSSMVLTNLFTMAMSTASAVAMFLLGAAMVVSGGLMARGPGM